MGNGKAEQDLRETQAVLDAAVAECAIAEHRAAAERQELEAARARRKKERENRRAAAAMLRAANKRGRADVRRRRRQAPSLDDRRLAQRRLKVVTATAGLVVGSGVLLALLLTLTPVLVIEPWDWRFLLVWALVWLAQVFFAGVAFIAGSVREDADLIGRLAKMSVVELRLLHGQLENHIAFKEDEGDW